MASFLYLMLRSLCVVSLSLSSALWSSFICIYIFKKKKICILNPPPFFSFSFNPQKMPQHPRHPVPKRFTQFTLRGGILHFRCHYCDAVLQTRDGLWVHLNSAHPRLYRCQFLCKNGNKWPPLSWDMPYAMGDFTAPCVHHGFSETSDMLLKSNETISLVPCLILRALEDFLMLLRLSFYLFLAGFRGLETCLRSVLLQFATARPSQPSSLLTTNTHSGLK